MTLLNEWVDDVVDVLNTLMARFGRTLVLAATVSLGVAGSVASLGLSQTAAHQVQALLTPRDRDSLTVVTPVTEAQRGRLLSYSGVVSVTSEITVPAAVSRVRRYQPSMTEGPALIGVDNYWLAGWGAQTSPSHVRWHPDGALRTALLGQRAAARLGIPGPGPGRSVWVGDERFDVTGVLTDVRDRPDVLDAVVVSLPVAQRLQGGGVPLTMIRTRPGFAPVLAPAVPFVVDAGRPDHVQVVRPPDIESLRRGVQTDLDRLVASAGIVLLLVSGLTTACVMWLSVMARQGEIGLRRALGSSRLRVARLFMLEGGAVGLLGSALGLPAGVLTILVIASVRGWAPVLAPSLALTAAAAGLLSGLAFATAPAVRAARVEPAEAVRPHD